MIKRRDYRTFKPKEVDKGNKEQWKVAAAVE